MGWRGNVGIMGWRGKEKSKGRKAGSRGQKMTLPELAEHAEKEMN
jgi:hypothetical protein